MRKRRKFKKNRISRPRRNRNYKHSGYKAVIEILLVIAVIEGAFFIINNYKKAKPPRAAKVEAVKPVIVKPRVTRPKVEEPIKPKIEVARIEEPKPKPEPKILPEPEEIKPRYEPIIPPEPKKIKPKPRPQTAVKKPRLPAGSQGKIAIVLDDWGYSLNNMDIAGRINYPFTGAVLPNLRYSKAAAEGLHKRGKEVILHLPMEPQSRLGMEKDTILTSMDDGQIKDIVGNDLDNIVYARGINNNMGSKATGDPRVMEEVLKELKKRRLYFLDSAVIPESAGPGLADKLDVAFAKRDVFLDNESDPEYIKGQIEKLKLTAKKNGFAVGIGHDRKNTLEVLEEVMPALEEDGYKLVFVSELTR